MILYDSELSADCYKVRLLSSLLRLEPERVELDTYPGCEHESDWFRAIDPLGRLPVLVDAPLTLCEVNDILVHLAGRYAPERAELPDDRPGWHPTAAVRHWLRTADRLRATAGAARLHDTLGADADIDTCRAGAHGVLREIDEHLWFAEQDGDAWLASRSHPTLADIACFPDVMLCEEGGVSRLPYPAVRRWTDRVKQLDQFIPMPGIFPA